MRLDGVQSFTNKIIEIIVKLGTKSKKVFLYWFKVLFQHFPQGTK